MKIQGINERPELIPTVAEYLFGEWRTFWIDFGYPDATSVASWLLTITGPDSLPYYAVGTSDNDLVCIGGVDANEREGDPRGPWLMDVFVVPEFRGSGAFKPIVSHIMQSQKDRGVQVMWTWTKPHHAALYEPLGFEFKMMEEWITEDKGKCLNPVLVADLTKFPPC